MREDTLKEVLLEREAMETEMEVSPMNVKSADFYKLHRAELECRRCRTTSTLLNSGVLAVAQRTVCHRDEEFSGSMGTGATSSCEGVLVTFVLRTGDGSLNSSVNCEGDFYSLYVPLVEKETAASSEQAFVGQ